MVALTGIEPVGRLGRLLGVVEEMLALSCCLFLSLRGLFLRRQIELEEIAGCVVQILVDAQIPLGGRQRGVAER
jgi:hypothetical protein